MKLAMMLSTSSNYALRSSRHALQRHHMPHEMMQAVQWQEWGPQDFRALCSRWQRNSTSRMLGGATENLADCRMTLIDLMAGEYVYIRSLGQSGFDGFSCDVFEEPEVSVASFASITSPSQSRSLLEGNTTAVGTTSQAALLSSGITFSIRDSAGMLHRPQLGPFSRPEHL